MKNAFIEEITGISYIGKPGKIIPHSHQVFPVFHHPVHDLRSGYSAVVGMIPLIKGAEPPVLLFHGRICLFRRNKRPDHKKTHIQRILFHPADQLFKIVRLDIIITVHKADILALCNFKRIVAAGGKPAVFLTHHRHSFVLRRVFREDLRTAVCRSVVHAEDLKALVCLRKNAVQTFPQIFFFIIYRYDH